MSYGGDFYGPPDAQVPLDQAEYAEKWGEPSQQPQPSCICPGLSDEPDCPRHGEARSR
jgi:hypothetical protein